MVFTHFSSFDNLLCIDNRLEKIEERLLKMMKCNTFFSFMRYFGCFAKYNDCPLSYKKYRLVNCPGWFSFCINIFTFIK